MPKDPEEMTEYEKLKEALGCLRRALDHLLAMQRGFRELGSPSVEAVSYQPTFTDRLVFPLITVIGLALGYFFFFN